MCQEQCPSGKYKIFRFAERAPYGRCVILMPTDSNFPRRTEKFGKSREKQIEIY